MGLGVIITLQVRLRYNELKLLSNAKQPSGRKFQSTFTTNIRTADISQTKAVYSTKYVLYAVMIVLNPNDQIKQGYSNLFYLFYSLKLPPYSDALRCFSGIKSCKTIFKEVDILN